ncbi:hypothetical protein HHI36_015216 [Cryptolaemus montrouzieri]|uniref:Uncharacterized protein n=1 Tax=Cryptolaemus montrouzieri TaxID=559131 RepID=A0ABD2N589_9CUCU
MPKKKLSDNEIENTLLYEEIPSDTDSHAGGDGSDLEHHPDMNDGPTSTATQDILLQSSDEEYKSDDDVPLPVLRCGPPASECGHLPEPQITAPKWKRTYSI